MIISPSWGRRKLGNPRGNLHLSVGDGVPSHTVWGYSIKFRKQAHKFTNLKNSSNCFGNWTPGPGGGRPVLPPLGHWDTWRYVYVTETFICNPVYTHTYVSVNVWVYSTLKELSQSISHLDNYCVASLLALYLVWLRFVIYHTAVFTMPSFVSQ